MTATELLKYYSNLLPNQYLTQANAVATVQALAYLGLMPQDGGLVYDPIDGSVVTDPITGEPVTVLDPDARPILPLAILPAFDINTAVGQQLKFLAQASGVTNTGFDLFGNNVTLDNDQFRILVRMAVARNYIRATLPEILHFVLTYFPGILTVMDDLFMNMTYYYSAPIGSNLPAEMFINQGLLPRPLGVNADVVVFGYDYFGFLEDPDADTFGDITDPTVGGFMPMILT